MKSTQKGLLKNVQDGISRPLGSREIHKAERRRVFLFHPLDDKVPESKDNINEIYSKSLKHLVTQIIQLSYLKWIMV